jgi:hypothetical protein
MNVQMRVHILRTLMALPLVYMHQKMKISAKIASVNCPLGCVHRMLGNRETPSPHVITTRNWVESSFPNFHECSYNCISIRKKCFNFFYNIAQNI